MPAQLWENWDVEISVTHAGQPLWGVWQVRADGRDHVHVFPHGLIAATAEVHGFGEDEHEAIVEAILHEPYLPDPADPLAWEIPGNREIFERVRDLPAPGQDKTASRATLREAHLERIAAVREHAVQLDPARREHRQAALDYVGEARTAPGHPCDPIHECAALPEHEQREWWADAWADKRRRLQERWGHDLCRPMTFGVGRLGYLGTNGA